MFDNLIKKVKSAIKKSPNKKTNQNKKNDLVRDENPKAKVNAGIRG